MSLFFSIQTKKKNINMYSVRQLTAALTALCIAFPAFAAPPKKPASAASQPTGAASLLLNKARALEGRGRLDLAAQIWKQVLLTDSSQQEALAGLARWAKQNGRDEDARNYLGQLRRVSPNHNAIAAVESMNASAAQKRRLEAAASLSQAKKYDEAMAVYREVFGSQPPAGGWSIAYYETLSATAGGYEPALSALRALADRYPANASYKISVGRIMTYRPEHRLAGIRMLESVPASADTAGAARQAWRQALIWEGRNPAAASSARAYTSRHRDAEIEKLAASMPAADPAKPTGPAFTADETAGYQALNQNQIAQAQARFESALVQNPKSAPALAGSAFVLMKLERFDEAAKQFEHAAAVDPSTKGVQAALAEARFWSAMKQASSALDKADNDAAINAFEAALAVRPNDLDATRGLSGAQLRAQNFKSAAGLFEKLIQANANDAAAWRGLITARTHTAGPAAAIQTAKTAPAAVKQALELEYDHLALMAGAYEQTGKKSDAAAYLKKAADLAASRNEPLPSTITLQSAASQLAAGRAEAAADLYGKVAQAEPENLVAWEGLVGALLAQDKPQAAYETIAALPQPLYKAALARPNFLRSAAIAHAGIGLTDAAESLLAETIRRDGPDKAPAALQVQLASIWIQRGQTAEAEKMLARVIEKHPTDSEAWRTRLTAMQRGGDAAGALAASKRMPPIVSVQLQKDPGYVSLIASLHAAAGSSDEALQLVRQTEQRLQAAKNQIPTGLLLQHGWLLLNGKGDEKELYTVLNSLGERKNLDAAETRGFNEMWSIWTRRRAEAAHKEGDLARASAILEATARLLPKDDQIQRSLAGMLVESGEHKRAVDAYKKWGLSGASAADYSGAVGAAMSARDGLSTKWLADGMKRYPNDPQLLKLAGQIAAQKGDFRQAEQYYKAALSATVTTAVKEQEQVRIADANEDPTRRLGRLLLNEDPGAPALNGISMANSLVDPEKAARKSQADEIAGRLQSLASRNTPFFGINTSVQDRTGQNGFEKRMLQETEITSSTVIGDSLRVSLIARPTTIETSASAGSEQYRFGLLPQGASFGAMSANGLAAELQLSSQNFGVRAGASPQGFLVKNYVGGIRFRPNGGPIQFMINRDNVKDSFLSYAGARDPITKRVWGGVVANTFALQGNWGTEKSGFYVGAGYQTITGQEVATNKRLDGNAGTYWQVLNRAEGSLTLGLNLTAMSYEKNLRYFTTGHGGYFSPQRFYIFNVPINWKGVYNKRFHYTVNSSIGSQYFREDSAPMFPTLGSVQSFGGGFYDASSSTGAGYSVDFNGLYQLNENWFIGGFLNFNNARYFKSQNAGVSLKYSFKKIPLGGAAESQTVPDWRGSQPFLLR